jgi:hypothetical protein
MPCAPQRGFGILQCVIGPHMRTRTDGAADSDRAVHQFLLQQQRRGHRGLRSFRYSQDVVLVGTPFQEEGELIASKARQK